MLNDRNVYPISVVPITAMFLFLITGTYKWCPMTLASIKFYEDRPISSMDVSEEKKAMVNLA